VYVPGRDGVAALEKDAAMKRAFGNNDTPVPDVVAMDRLAGGRAAIAPDVEGFSTKALAEALTALGLTTAAGNPKVHGDILEARSNPGRREVALRVKYELRDAAGKVLYTAVKTSVAGPDDGIGSESDALRVALRKSAEALGLDPAFVAAIPGGHADIKTEAPAPEAASAASPVVAKAELAPAAAPEKPATKPAPPPAPHLTGGLAGAQAIWVPGREGVAALEKDAAMKRAFGNNDTPVPDVVPVDHLRGGRATIAPNVEAVSTQALSEALAAMGVTTVAGKANLTGEIQDAKVDRGGRRVAIRVRFELKDAAGKVLFSTVKAAVAGAEDGAESEAGALRLALRKSAEALAAEPAFAAAIQ
jgi:hypothetical protein